ncbi:MAG: phosphotransferase family protein [Defluviitaleaceae bacterium]|nr:phosphotransferase family protein [Defluviitaleaceae bacterium]
MLNREEIGIIANALNCSAKDLTQVQQIKKGMTNRSFLFTLGGKKYIARIPGAGTQKLISRTQEYEVYTRIAPLGLGDDVVYMNPANGYKITVFWEDARVCDPADFADVAKCMKVLKSFHDRKLQADCYFDIFERIDFYQGLLTRESCYADYRQTKAGILELKDYLQRDPVEMSLSHIDPVPDNFLFVNGGIRLIDWEYSAMQDRHLDIAMFAVYAMYERENVEELIDCYFEGECPDNIRTKIYAYIAICGLLWSNWCEYKTQLGTNFGQYALKQYQYAKYYYQVYMGRISGAGGA